MNYHLEYFRARETSLIGYLKLSSFFSFLFSSLLLFFLFSFLSRSTAAPLDYRIDDRKRRISRAYELLHSIPLINHSLRLYYHDHAKSMETRYALFISITGNFFSLFNINTIFFYSFSSFFFSLSFSSFFYIHILLREIYLGHCHIYSHYRRCFIQICLLDFTILLGREYRIGWIFHDIWRAFLFFNVCDYDNL